MGWKGIAAASLALALAAGCSTEPAAPANNQAAAAPAPTPAPANPVQRRYDNTMSGQPLTRPPTPFQLLVTQVTYQPGHRIPCHKHSYPRYVYLQQGSLRVHNFVTGQYYPFAAGAILVESIDQWHEGLVTSDVPVVLVAVEQVPPGQSNSTPWTPPPAVSPCTPRAPG